MGTVTNVGSKALKGTVIDERGHKAPGDSQPKDGMGTVTYGGFGEFCWKSNGARLLHRLRSVALF